MKPTFIAAALVSLVVALGALIGCQTYDFEPVNPIAIAQTTQSYKTIGSTVRPDLMLLVDKSGSMSTVDPGQTSSRMANLQTAMSGFLTNNGTIARMGLVLFPQGGGCTLTTATAVQLPPLGPNNSDPPAADLQNAANQIRTTINATVPSGGTPTADAIAYVAQDPNLSDPIREDFILLLTDGLPNCDPNLDGTTCQCTSTVTNACTATNSNQCLDDAAVVNTISGIRTNQGIRTIVIGFGADTNNPLGASTLQAMAVAGGFPRSCPGGTNAECVTPGVTCNPTTKQCSQAFYQAANATELANVLAAIASGVNPLPCDYPLAVTPSNPNFISVLINGTATDSGSATWQYVAPNATFPKGEVQLVGALCTQATNAKAQDPVNVEIRLLQTF
jgi:VWA domain-containing protein